MSRIYVAVDLETTGFSAERDEILEIGAVKFRVPVPPGEDPVIARWTTLVHPGRPIPYRISRLTGITQEELTHAPPLARVLDDLRDFIGNYPVVGHNVAFELAFLQRHGLLVGQAHLDTFELASLLLPAAPRYSLGQLAAFLGITFEGWHRALADAEMAMRLFLELWDEASALPPATLEAIVAAAMDSRWPLRSFFAGAQRAARPLTRPTPTHARPEPPAPDGPLPALSEHQPLPLGEIARLLTPDGQVAQGIEQYEPRTEQAAMLDAVARAFATETHLVVEAGTGSGKTLAYAIAAIYEATRRSETVVISTNTLTLQDQLFYDELPRLSQSLERPFTVQRLKGRTNYLCPRRVEMLRRRGSFSPAEARLLARVLIWMQRTTSGDRAELNLQPEEEAVWELLCADTESCRADRCAPYGTCFWLRAHERASHAHLLIVNHALLLADLSAGGGLLPPYQSLIVDEAHHLEDQATQQFGFTLPQGLVYAALARLGHEERGRATGLLALIRRDAREERRRNLAPLVEQCGLLLRQVEQARESADELFACLDEMLRQESRQESRFRIGPEWRARAEWRELARRVERFVGDLTGLSQGLVKIEPQLGTLGLTDAVWMDRADECRRAAALLETLCQETQRILLMPEADDVTWLIAQPNGGEGEEEGEVAFQISLCRAPIHVAPLLRERLFEAKRSVILTSATLGTEGGFTFLRERLGIQRAEELSVGSPYDYARQALVYVADDLPEPNQPNYATTLHRALSELAQATEGRMLVLFTSRSQLNATYRAISAPLARDDIIVLGQYLDGTRSHLLERFRTMERAVLLGTHSFWEGVDIPGPALSCLVITRLPFPVPTDPIHAARSESYQNAFLDYMVPQTVIRFRQGVGRLLRTQSDRGIVALLDSRLESKRYGQTFLNSLPPAALHIGRFRDLPPLAQRWLRDEGGGMGGRW